MVFYRKYRPQTISELDLASVREKLTSVLSSKDLPHAFLFTGGKGLGKTSSARILAKAINCQDKKGIEPCNKCEICQSITNGSNIDVLEIDAASNGGVEEIRALRERVKFSSAGLEKKVYIIDEVHMLTTGAFNALLKTLEEPPEHVVFILATTELHKLPSTVISRTFQVKFEKPSKEEMIESLARIVKGENLDVEKGVLEKISDLSDGAFRDAAKNLEELAISSGGKKITQELLDKVFKIGGIKEDVANLLKAYAKKDAKKSLEIIAHLASSGADFKIVIERLVDHLRGLLMLRNGISSEENDIDLSIKDINELLHLANDAYSEMKLSFIPSLPLELMTVKFCILDSDESNNKPDTMNKDFIQKSKQNNPAKGSSEDTKNLKDKEVSLKVIDRKKLLKELIEKLNKLNKPGAALLRSAAEANIIDDKLIIKTPFPIHAERLKSDKVFGDLKKVVMQVIGIEVGIEIETVSKLSQ